MRVAAVLTTLIPFLAEHRSNRRQSRILTVVRRRLDAQQIVRIRSRDALRVGVLPEGHSAATTNKKMKNVIPWTPTASCD